jgi:hypothetical protein
MPLHDVGDAMHEYKRGQLHSGKGGPKVASRKQAIAIGMSAKRKAKGKRAPAQRALTSGGR